MADLISNFLNDDSQRFVEAKPCLVDRAELRTEQPKCIFPGSFNPLHRGHNQMAKVATALLGMPVWFELSVTNVEKPALQQIDILSRLSQDFGSSSVFLTKAPTFAEKSEVFPNSTFVVGADTILRVDQTRYYESSGHQKRVFQSFKEREIRFMVFGREIDGAFRSEDIPISDSLKSLCRFIPQTEFDIAISSTEIRTNLDR